MDANGFTNQLIAEWAHIVTIGLAKGNGTVMVNICALTMPSGITTDLISTSLGILATRGSHFKTAICQVREFVVYPD